ncbi:filamentous hemagglutinin N-terminal domain-containing protein [Tolypothrix sp. VBCCA 56010]|uniref:two-partner secretion domain-containing protein n=1 Tax=Tolypothrix sp. VBCCA 56010 TaxID=3137731 RepID=UPI003D7EC025
MSGMIRYWQRWALGKLLVVGGAIAFSGKCAFAQELKPIPDNTLGAESSLVRTSTSDSPVDIIDGGAQRGANLFHSFREFNVGEGRGAYFYSRSADIQNILARVTGNNPSKIFGTIGTYGNSNPNLFLINPKGIIFGPNASLDMGNAGLNNPRPGGSFLATTANAIRLGDNGIFSASEPATSNLLTVNPSALFFNAVSRQGIVNQSTATNSVLGWSINGLQVPDGRSLLLVGGDVKLDGGKITASGGRVELGGVSEPGTVGLNIDSNNLRLSFPQGVQRGDVSLSNEATVNVAAGDGGSITVNAGNLDISDSELLAGIAKGLGTVGSQAGNITLDATGTIEITGSSVSNYVATEAVGNGGDITVKGRSLSLNTGANISTITYGMGNTANIVIQVSESVSLDTGAAISSYVGSLGSALVNENPLPIGNSGNITIRTGSLSLAKGAQLAASTFGQGNAGSVFVEADGSISLIDVGTAVFNTVGFQDTSAVGNSGGITFKAQSLFLADGAQLIASTFGQGNAGSIFLQVDGSISLVGGSIVESQLPSEPTLPGSPFLAFPANLSESVASTGIFSTVESKAQGNAGGIKIQSRSLSLTNGSEVQSLTRGEGNAGNIQINAANFVNISGFASSKVAESDDSVILGGFSTGLISATEGEASGLGGNIELTTDTLRLSDGAVLNARTRNATSGGNITVKTNTVELTGGGQILTSAFNSGNAGNITVNANDSVNISGSDPTYADRQEQFGEAIVDNDGSNSGLFARVRGNATANAGTIEVNARSIRLDKQGTITTETTLGEGGDITLKVRDILLLRNNSSITATAGTASAGGNGGNITINAPNGFLVAVPRENSDITANAYTGSGGNIQINAFGVYGTQFREKENRQTSDITASSDFGINGTVEINTPEIDPSRGLINLPTVPLDTEVSQVCQPRTAENQSSFIITGRGGLPPNPRTDLLTPDAVQVDWVTLKPSTQNRSNSSVSSKRTTATPEKIVEATGWVRNEKGEVVLTANPPTVTPHGSWQKPADCSAIQSNK